MIVQCPVQRKNDLLSIAKFLRLCQISAPEKRRKKKKESCSFDVPLLPCLDEIKGRLNFRYRKYYSLVGQGIDDVIPQREGQLSMIRMPCAPLAQGCTGELPLPHRDQTTAYFS